MKNLGNRPFLDWICHNIEDNKGAGDVQCIIWIAICESRATQHNSGKHTCKLTIGLTTCFNHTFASASKTWKLDLLYQSLAVEVRKMNSVRRCTWGKPVHSQVAATRGKEGQTVASVLHPNAFCNDDLWKSTFSVCGLVWKPLRVWWLPWPALMHHTLLRVLKVIFQNFALGAMKNKASKPLVSLKTIADKSQTAGDVAGTLEAL